MSPEFEGSAAWNFASRAVRTGSGECPRAGLFPTTFPVGRECRSGERTNGVPAPTGSGPAHLLEEAKQKGVGRPAGVGTPGLWRNERDQGKSQGPSQACVARTCHPSPWEVEVGGPAGQNHPRL